MKSFYKIPLANDFIYSFALGFTERYAKYFPDFSDIAIILPNSFALAEFQKQIQVILQGKEFIMPQLYSPVGILNQNADFAYLELKEKIAILNFLKNKQREAKKESDLFTGNYFNSLNIKNLTIIATDLLNLRNNKYSSLEKQKTGYTELLEILFSEYQKQSSFANNDTEFLLNLVKTKLHTIYFTIPSENDSESKLHEILLNSENNINISFVYPNTLELNKDNETATPWIKTQQKNNIDIFAYQQNYSAYYEAKTEAEEIDFIFQKLLQNLNKNIRTNIICADYKFASNLKQKITHYFPEISSKKNPNILVNYIIELLIKEITTEEFLKKTNKIFYNSDIVNNQKIIDIINQLEKLKYYKISKIFDFCGKIIKSINSQELSQEILCFFKPLKNNGMPDLNIRKDELKTIMLFLFRKEDDFSLYHKNFIISSLTQSYCLETEATIVSNFKHSYYKQKYHSDINYNNFISKFTLTLCKKNIIFTWNNEDLQQNSNVFYETLYPYLLKHSATYKIKKRTVRKNVTDYVTPPKQARQHDFAITKIEKLLHNPYALYAEKILRIKPQPQNYDNLALTQYGNAVHYAAQQFTRNFAILDSNKYHEFLIAEFTKHIDKNQLIELKTLLLEKFKSGLEKIIDFEIKSQKNYKYCHPEILLEEKINNTRIFGRLDRLNIIDKKYQVIDYKTGTLPNKKQIHLGLKGQIIIASLLARKKFKLEDGESTYVKFTENKLEKRSVDYDLEIEEKLSKLLKKYQNPNTKLYITPDKNLKYFNEYRHLCRE